MTIPKITTHVVEQTHLFGESAGRATKVIGTEIRIFADGRLVGVVEVPALVFQGQELELCGRSVTVAAADSDEPFAFRQARCRFPSGSGITLDPNHVASVEEAVRNEQAKPVTPKVTVRRHKFEGEVVEGEYDVYLDDERIGRVARVAGTPNGYFGRWRTGRYYTDTRASAVKYLVKRHLANKALRERF